MTRATRAYGAHPLHLLSLVASFALVGYAVSLLGVASLWNHHHWWQSIIVWFFGAVLLHDLFLFPSYALADRSLGAGWRAVSGRTPARPPAVSPVNYLRIPTLASGLLLLMFFPGIIRQGSDSYLRATGLTQTPYLQRWLLVTGVLFAVSALLYAARMVIAGRRRRHLDATADHVDTTIGDATTGGGSRHAP